MRRRPDWLEHCAGTLRIDEFLTRIASVPLHRSRSRRRGAGSPRSLSRQRRRLPVLICRGTPCSGIRAIKIADCLGFNDAIDRTHVRDPDRGRGADRLRVYARRRAVARLESNLPWSSRLELQIENYLVFPTGFQFLTFRAAAYAQRRNIGAQSWSRTAPRARVAHLCTACTCRLRASRPRPHHRVGGQYRKPSALPQSSFEGGRLLRPPRHGSNVRWRGGRDRLWLHLRGQARYSRAGGRTSIRVRDGWRTLCSYLVLRIEDTRDHAATRTSSWRGRGQISTRNCSTVGGRRRARNSTCYDAGAVRIGWLVLRGSRGRRRHQEGPTAPEDSERGWPLVGPRIFWKRSSVVFAVGDVLRQHQTVASPSEKDRLPAFVHQVLINKGRMPDSILPYQCHFSLKTSHRGNGECVKSARVGAPSRAVLWRYAFLPRSPNRPH